MLYEDTTYKIESEIDNAFPYLIKLNAELDQLYRLMPKKINIKEILQNKFKTPIKIIEKRQLIKSKGFKKDGYYFRVRLYKIYNEANESQILYYEFYVNIKYVNTIINKQFYKKISNKKDAILYFENMLAVFKHLRRRDLMERLFKEKEEEIENLNKLINR